MANQLTPIYNDGLQGVVSFPDNTDGNLSQTQIATASGNTVDSVAGININTFVEALQSGLSFPSSIYDTGNLDIDLTRLRLTNNSGKNFRFKITIGGTLISDSTLNSAIFAVRLNSTPNIGTGTLRRYPAGLTTGSATIDLGFNTVGAFSLADGESVWLECAKNTLGTLIIQSCLVIIEPIF